ncbi:radical SAM/SPASM domain-containing protein [Pedobacter cryoconitis]|uniref:Radical SAM core domain-containing protein n=1 Tax=Pedobacter cryoconitis TaxID=188932 RepID=A0A7X0J0Y4_9SPHI|nr:radical SAM protein [Pedobacter cryoconitis]MBB6499064.1 uncharacterized protein [Pedobacter cryoconitis]
MQLFKSSPYNVLIPIDEREEFLIFNTLTGGIEILNSEEGKLLSELSCLKYFQKEVYPENLLLLEHLISKEYIIDSEKNMIEIFEKNSTDHQFKNTGTIYLTIGTTISCNMGCSYCFEFVKPNHTLKDDKVKKQTVIYIDEIIRKAEQKIHTLSITWYGGEPLLNVKAIEDMSVGLIELAEKYNLTYTAKIITNGIYLTETNVKKLIDNKVELIQVTIDGAREIHDKKRPLKQKNAKNYYRILENLSQIPEGINVLVRMNVDHEVANSSSDMLDDFQSFGIWPNKYKQFSFDPAWLRSYEEIALDEDEKDIRMHVDAFFDFKQNFRLNLLERFNNWANLHNTKSARLKWDLPSYQSTCATWASPISLVVDPNGFIHKCWETIHDDTKAPSSVFDSYDPKVFDKYSAFNRYSHNDVCRNCKYLPVCDKISCSFEAIKNTVPQCTEWKYKTESYIREQYLRMINKPETINVPTAAAAVNTGHSNK